MLLRVLDFANKYRLSVYLLFVALTLNVWFFLPLHSSNFIIVYAVGLSFLAGFIWIYLFNKICDTNEDAISQPTEAAIGNETRILKGILPLLVIAPLFVFYYFSLPLWPFALYIFLGFLYSYPIYRGYRIKSIPFIKNVAGAFYGMFPLWAGLSIYFVDYYIFPVQANYLFLLGLFCLYMLGELIWDIRDIEGDRASKVLTIPVLFGVTISKIYGFILIIIAYAALPKAGINWVIIGAFVFFLVYARPRTSKYFFHALLYTVSALLLIALWMRFHFQYA